MQGFWLDISANLLADVISWLLVIFVGLIIVGRFIIRRHSRLRRFFGLTGQSDRLMIYLSSMPIVEEGLITRDNEKLTTSQLMINAGEMEIIPWLTLMFAANPLQRLPDTVKRLFGHLWAFRPVYLDLKPSPLSEKELGFGSMLIIGGPFFNSAAKYYQERKKSPPHSRFDRDFRDKTNWTSLSVTIGAQHKLVLETSPSEDVGILQKIVDKDHGATIILAAGARTNGTKAAVFHLVQNWSEIFDKYGEEEFIICLQCAGKDKDPEGYQWAVPAIQSPP